MTPVPLVYEMTDAPESEVLDTLLLKSDQSDDETHPFVEPFAVSHVIAFTDRVTPLENVSGDS